MNAAIKDMKNIQAGSIPSCAATQIAKIIMTIETESQPWSTNSPSGDALFVRRACLPSIASRDWYTNRPTALKTNAHHGACEINNI